MLPAVGSAIERYVGENTIAWDGGPGTRAAA
jgi:hypothetical protein